MDTHETSPVPGSHQRSRRGAPAPLQQRTALRVNGDRLNGWLARFDAIGRTAGGINRVAYSDADLAGRAFTLDLFRQSGLTPRVDAAGNIFARLDGTRRRAAADPDRLARRLGDRRRQLRRPGRLVRRDRGRAIAARAERAPPPSARGRGLAERGRRHDRQQAGDRRAHGRRPRRRRRAPARRFARASASSAATSRG